MALKLYQLLTWEFPLSILLQAGSSADVFGKIKTSLDGNVQFETVHSWHHNSAIGEYNQKKTLQYPLGITHLELWWNYSTGCVSLSLKLIWCGAFAENGQDTIIQSCCCLIHTFFAFWCSIACPQQPFYAFLVIPMCQGWSLRWSAPCKRTCRSIG